MFGKQSEQKVDSLIVIHNDKETEGTVAVITMCSFGGHQRFQKVWVLRIHLLKEYKMKQTN